MWLLHAYPLYTMNGSFYLDSKLWPHHCKETGGGWGDFFASDQEVIDWTPEKEKAGGEVCLRQKAQQVDELLHKLGTGTEELDGMAVNKVNSAPCSYDTVLGRFSSMLVFCLPLLRCCKL